VARASLEELLEDYRDFLRTRQAEEWDKSSKEALYVRKLAMGRVQPPQGTNRTDGTKETASSTPHTSRSSRKSPATTYDAFRPFEDRSAEVRANIIICLIHQTNYLLDRQIRKLEQDFLREGGLRERMTRARIEVRDEQRRNRS
jgi:four helix bundle suffix protein